MDMVKVQEFVHARALERKHGDTKHGSKLQQLVEVIRGILIRPGDERAIVFCQFADLEMQISQALTDFSIAHSRLSTAGDIFERTAVLDDFQHQRGGRRVLLLSLEQSASGTNLTVANHVLFVHPMAASTPERALAFEQQAVSIPAWLPSAKVASTVLKHGAHRRGQGRLQRTIGTGQGLLAPAARPFGVAERPDVAE
eukprot:CAMPEP_0180556784 /NCGR_PEP_ID=MMETSP1037_2-20121125/793_1 /TAXON_ID=632150 /ORGANISM="Azadinium spinosum, Strain 3D9" /LENGTH=197 /DNA_ID=CAMNT_0022572903 /DNA_START=100 /DNA_END=694 /DNA_ORIENTATION=+